MFYPYDQNNSGGSFHYDGKAGIGRLVIIEAEGVGSANDRAQRIGLDFSGKYDCQCCGRRWAEAWETTDPDNPAGYDVPTDWYGTEITMHKYYGDREYGVTNTTLGDPESVAYGFIHYLNGEIRPILALPSPGGIFAALDGPSTGPRKY